jgi:hypothetical protein
MDFPATALQPFRCFLHLNGAATSRAQLVSRCGFFIGGVTMTTEVIDSAQVGSISEQEQVSYYRTQWLTAHNRLHDVTMAYPELLKGEWESYLRRLQSQESTAKKTA